MKPVVLQILCAVVLACGAGIASADSWKDESGKGGDRHRGEKEWKEEKSEKKKWKDRKDKKEWKDERRGSYFHKHGYTRLRIPPGHYPPPGECRVWYPDRPAGHQPPPGGCGRPVPPGAWLISHPPELPGHVYVSVYEPQRPHSVLVVGEFEIGSGAFVRVVVGR